MTIFVIVLIVAAIVAIFVFAGNELGNESLRNNKDYQKRLSDVKKKQGELNRWK